MIPHTMAQMISRNNLPERAIEREECFKHLTQQPEDLVVRLQLARLFFEDKFYEFAIRELAEIRRRANPPPPSLLRLIAAFGTLAGDYLPAESAAAECETDDQVEERTAADTLAELDMDAEFADLLVDLEVDAADKDADKD